MLPKGIYLSRLNIKEFETGLSKCQPNHTNTVLVALSHLISCFGLGTLPMHWLQHKVFQQATEKKNNHSSSHVQNICTKKALCDTVSVQNGSLLDGSALTYKLDKQDRCEE